MSLLKNHFASSFAQRATGGVSAPVISYNPETETFTSTRAGQWLLNGAPIDGETGLTYTPADISDVSGQYVSQPGSNSIMTGGATLPVITSIKLVPLTDNTGGTGFIDLSEVDLRDSNGDAPAGIWTVPSGYTQINGAPGGATINSVLTDGSNATGRIGSFATDAVFVRTFTTPSSAILGGTIALGTSGNSTGGWGNFELYISTGGAYTLHTTYTGTWTYPYQVTEPVHDIPLPDAAINITSATPGGPDLANGHPYPTLRLQGTYTGGTTDLIFTGTTTAGVGLEPLSDPVAVTGGVFDYLLPLANPADQGIVVKAWAIDAADPTRVGYNTSAVGYYAERDPVEMGINSSEWSAFGVADIMRNRFEQTSYRLYSTTYSYDQVTPVPLDEDGYPTGELPARIAGPGQTGAGAPNTHLAIYFYEGPTSSQRSGPMEGTVPPGINNDGFISAANISAASVDNPTGTFEFTVNSATASTNLAMLINGNPTPIAGEEGFTGPQLWRSHRDEFTLYPAADTNRDRPTTDQHKLDYGKAASATKHLRFMKLSLVENESVQQSRSRKFYNPEFIAKVSNFLDVNPWITELLQLPEAGTIDFAERTFALLGPALLAYIETSNEDWNQDYIYPREILACGAANAGLIVGVPAEGELVDDVPASAVFGASHLVNWDSGAALVAFNAGDRFYTRGGTGYQTMIVRALVDTDIDDIIPGDGSQFEQLAAFDAINTGIRKQHVRETVRKGNLWKTVGGARVKTVLGAFKNDSVAFLTDLMMFEDAWQGIDHYTIDYYIGGKQTYNPTATPWHADVTLNPSNFQTKYTELVGNDADARVESAVALIDGIEDRFRSHYGIPKTTRVPKHSSYEMGIHDSFESADSNFTGSITGNTLTVTVPGGSPLLLGMEVTAGPTSYGYVSVVVGGGVFTLTETQGSPVASGPLRGSVHAALTAQLAIFKKNCKTLLADRFYTPLKNKVGGLMTDFVDYEPFALQNQNVTQVFGKLSNSTGVRTDEDAYEGYVDMATV